MGARPCFCRGFCLRKILNVDKLEPRVVTGRIARLAGARANEAGATGADDVILDALLHRSKHVPDTRPAAYQSAQLTTLRAINARLLREVEALKQREAHALRLADRDGLTGLYNRRRMSELLEESIAEASRLTTGTGTPWAMIS